MSNIVENLKKILTARYGKDVRRAIHDGILNCYEDGKAGAIDMTARDAIQAEAVTRENEDNALDERVQALEAGGAGLSDLTYEAWEANTEQYEAEDKGFIVPMQEITPEGEKIFLFDTNDIALDKASKSVLSSSTAGGAFREIISKLNGLINYRDYEVTTKSNTSVSPYGAYGAIDLGSVSRSSILSFVPIVVGSGSYCSIAMHPTLNSLYVWSRNAETFTVRVWYVNTEQPT